MTIKLDALASWKLVPTGGALKLPSDSEETRRIRIDVNCEDETRVYVSHLHAAVAGSQFVACVGPGLETIEFYAAGDLEVLFSASGEDSQVWLYTSELDPNVSEVPDAVSFTEIHQRRARNPELEMMQLIARQNERRMDDQMARLEALIAEKERVTNVDNGTPPSGAGAASDGADDGVQPPPVKDKAIPVEPAGGAGDAANAPG